MAKGSLSAWLDNVAQNDADHGRDSKDNPNNKPNGK